MISYYASGYVALVPVKVLGGKLLGPGSSYMRINLVASYC
jgi:hypothetical protein